MLVSKIKEFCYPRSEDSLRSTHMINQERFLGWMFFHLFQENIFRKTFRWLLLKRKKDIFNNHNVYDNKRCLHDSKNPHRIGLKRYLMNWSSRSLLNILFLFVKITPIRKGVVVLLKKRATGCFQSLYK